MTEAIANILLVCGGDKDALEVEEILAGSELNITRARSTHEALCRVQAQEFALVLLDMEPPAEAFNTASLIHLIKGSRHLPIIVLYAIEKQPELLKTLAARAVAGVVDCVFKPVVPQLLQAKVSLLVELFRTRERLQRRAEHETKERFRLLVESLHGDAVFLMDPQGRVTMWNREAERLRGWTEEEILGQSFEIFFTPENRQSGKPKKVLELAGETGRYEEDGWRMRKDGSRFWANVIYTPIANDGTLIGFSAVARDLTQQKKAEDELQKVNAELERRVAQQTNELISTIAEREKLQEQLLHAQKMESIGTLAAGIAHDFNNLLNVISGYAAILRLEPNNAAAVIESAETIQQTVNRGAWLVQQLSASGTNAQISAEAVQLNEVIKKVQTLSTETFPKTIEISLSLDPKLPTAMVSATQIHEALLNLCVNARDVMQQGGKILLATETVRGGQLRQRFPDAIAEIYVCIRVSDTGTGIDEVTRKRIFEPFFTTKPQGQGTGLGLSVVYGVVTSHGGFIDLESSPAIGTTFWIYLPAGPGTTKLADLTQRSVREEPLGSGETVLFAEDEEKQLSLMRRFLEGQGYRVLPAKDGAEAVETYLRHKDEIAVVVLDLGLPKLNGWEAFKQMKQADPEVKALFATGLVSPEVEAEMTKGKVGGVITKPYQLENVLEKISATIQRYTAPALEQQATN